MEKSLTREQLAAEHQTEVYDPAEFSALFEVHSVDGPFVVVTRRRDGLKGTCEFQRVPRLYHSFLPHTEPADELK